LRIMWQLFFMWIFNTVTEMGSRRPRGLRPGSAATRLQGLRVRILPRAWMSVSCECCVLYKVEVSASVWSLVQRSPTNTCVWMLFWTLDY
jgi:hypothetical protein